MFPTPIQRTAPWVQRSYTWLLPLVLIIWLLPLIGIAVTSIRPASDLAQGNYFGLPTRFAGIENYYKVFQDSNIGYYISPAMRSASINSAAISWSSSCLSRAISCPSRSWRFRCET
jgi:ABC-type glycerol-3-phosphate transport system permease component